MIIDDGSPDGTAEIVKNLFANYPGQLFLEERVGKLGLGTAYIHGFRWALTKAIVLFLKWMPIFLIIPKILINYTRPAKQVAADVAVGSRYVKGGKVENWPWIRVFISKGASIYTRFITWMPVKDPTAGFVCYKSEVLEAINLDEISFVGYAFQIEMKFAAWKLGI